MFDVAIYHVLEGKVLYKIYNVGIEWMRKKNPKYNDLLWIVWLNIIFLIFFMDVMWSISQSHYHLSHLDLLKYNIFIVIRV